MNIAIAKMKQWAGLLSLGLVGAGVGPGWGQAVVVVNAANSIQDISKKQLIDIYTGKMASWSRKKIKIYPAALTLKNPVSRLFFEQGLGKKNREMQKAWLRLALSGASKPPKIVIADHDLIEYVAKNEGALGFVRQADLNEIQGGRTDIKVIKVEGKLPEEEGYIFSE